MTSSPCTFFLHSHQMYQAPTAIRDKGSVSADRSTGSGLAQSSSGKIDTMCLSGPQALETASPRPSLSHITCALGHKKRAWLTLPQSEEHIGHWLLVIICLLARTPR